MLIFGIDKFMSECRALVNFIGNAVATLFVAKWNHELDVDRARAVFAGKDVEPLFDPSEDLDVNPYDPTDHELVGANNGAQLGRDGSPHREKLRQHRPDGARSRWVGKGPPSTRVSPERRSLHEGPRRTRQVQRQPHRRRGRRPLGNRTH